jgi:hypothetical protein
MANWSVIRRHNRTATERRLRRIATAECERERISAAGGAITLSEIRGASRKVVSGAPGHDLPRVVWRFRDRDWLAGFHGGLEHQILMMCPFVEWRQEPDMSRGVPLTPAARQWLNSLEVWF